MSNITKLQKSETYLVLGNKSNNKSMLLDFHKRFAQASFSNPFWVSVYYAACCPQYSTLSPIQQTLHTVNYDAVTLLCVLDCKSSGTSTITILCQTSTVFCSQFHKQFDSTRTYARYLTLPLLTAIAQGNVSRSNRNRSQRSIRNVSACILHFALFDLTKVRTCSRWTCRRLRTSNNTREEKDEHSNLCRRFMPCRCGGCRKGQGWLLPYWLLNERRTTSIELLKEKRRHVVSMGARGIQRKWRRNRKISEWWLLFFVK